MAEAKSYFITIDEKGSCSRFQEPQKRPKIWLLGFKKIENSTKNLFFDDF